MDFTILIPSRNRTELLERAIQSVLAQTHDSFELLVINDGSDGRHAEGYRRLEQQYARKMRVVHLDARSAPHGKGRALNIGLSLARGNFVGFLDDDDFWIDSGHLSFAKAAIGASGGRIDVFFTNQEASASGATRRDLWLAAMANHLASHAKPAWPQTYLVTPELLLKQPGFCHMNTILARRDLVLGFRGFNETLRYEVDRDFYVRLIDRAQGIAYCANFTSHHTIPDASKQENMSTRVSGVEKLLQQLASFNQSIVFALRPEIRSNLRRSKRYALKDLAIALYQQGDNVGAFHFAREALLIGFTWRWLLYCGWLGIRAATGRDVKRQA